MLFNVDNNIALKRFKKLLYLLDLVSIDTISKFNLIKTTTTDNFSKFVIKTFLKNNETNFLSKIFYFAQACLLVTNQKINLFSIKREFNKKGKIRNTFIVCLGVTKHSFDIDVLCFIDYLIFCLLLSKKYDDSFHFKKLKKLFIYYFFNPNYLLGSDDIKFPNYSMNINFYIISNNHELLTKKQLINFYEKIFYPEY